MNAEGVLTAMGGRYTAAFYTFGSADTPFFPIDPVARIKTMRFVVDGELKGPRGRGLQGARRGGILDHIVCVAVDRPVPPVRAVRCRGALLSSLSLPSWHA
jgi:hypothetical protein